MSRINSTRRQRPRGVSLSALLLFGFAFLAFFGSLWMWGEGFLLNFPAGADYAFPVTDIVVNAPASVLAAVGLWRMKQWGYVASQFVAGFYTYASVEIFVMVAQEGPPYPMKIIVPQLAAISVAGVLVFYLWRIRAQFE